MSTRAPTFKASPAEAIRTGLAAGTLQRAVLDNLLYLQARLRPLATPQDWYMALAYSVRDRMLARWESTARVCARRDAKVACYLSAEYLIGPQLGNNLVNLGIQLSARTAMAALDQDLDTLIALEGEPGLGNGGLGRLAACYLDSLATLEVPAIGY
ncbi:MAG TPA: glycogen/starch/alpha-glucan phosphorylase, partial [Steroidobacteraceae bacterium]